MKKIVVVCMFIILTFLLVKYCLNKTCVLSLLKIVSIISFTGSDFSAGSDSLNLLVLKIAFPYVADILTSLINLCLKRGTFLDCLKIPKITPVFKGGNKNDLGNSRPISVLPVISRLLEKCINTRVYDHLELHNLLNPIQFGFRKARTTEMALSYITSIINGALDNKLRVAGLFLDLVKAFDTVDHQLLLRKCEFYGLRGATLALICDYLQNREHYVHINGFSSSKSLVKYGIPQGSVLGPTLFLIFINDLPNAVATTSRIGDLVNPAPSGTRITTPLFADDATLMCVASTEQQLTSTINAAMTMTCLWLKINRLDLNINKSNFVFFSRSPNYYPWIMEIATPKGIVKRSKSVKYLGIIIDEILSFKCHVKAISRILSRNLGIIRKLKHLFPSNVIRLLYFSLIHPYILYCSSVWLGTFPSVLRPIRVLQNNAIRSLCGIGNRDSVRSMYSMINIMPAAGLRDFYTLVFMYK